MAEGEGYPTRISIKAPVNGFDVLFSIDCPSSAIAITTADRVTRYLGENYGSSDPGGEGDGILCPIHRVPMSRKQRGSDVWYSHKLADGSWCKGK